MSNPFQFCGGTPGAAGANTYSPPMIAATAGGDTLAIAVLCNVAAGTPTSITDTQLNTWTLQDSETTNLPFLAVFVCENATALSLTDVITINYPGTTAIKNAIGVDCNNSDGTLDFDKKATGTTGSPTVSTGILSVPVENMVSFVADLNAGGAPTWTGGSTLIATQTSGTTGFLSAAFQETTTTPAKTAGATITSSTWNIITIGFPCEPVQVTSTVSGAVQGQPYSQTLTAVGGTGSYTWSIVSGSLPTGLSLSGGVISGTPTAAAGLYNFTVQAQDGVGTQAQLAQSITLTVLGVTATNTSLYANQLSAADSGAASSGITWVASTNAGTPAVSTHNALDGTQCVAWSSTANGDSSIITGSYPALPLKGYDVSGFMFSQSGNPVQVGVEFFNSSNTLIGSLVLGQQFTATGPNVWQPVQGLFTSPAGTAHIKVIAYASNTNAGDVTFIDLFYMARSQMQIVVDWINPPLVESPTEPNLAGNSFMDISPWVRLVDGVNLSRGRQDSISEVPAGAANFALQNDTGVFSPLKAASLINVSGGTTTLQRRVQISQTDEVGVWYTRFDGAISEIDFVGDNTGNTNVVTITAGDVLSPLSRADPLSCWTRETVRADGPSATWVLNDNGNTGAFGQAVESSGNNGPPLRTFDKDVNNAATIAWNDQTGGVETLADAVALTMPDGSEFWSAGSNQPSSLLRGLDSGTVGPYTTPLGSIFLSPCFATQASQNLFVGNSGFCLFTELGPNNLLSPNAPGEDFSVEVWFSMDTSGDVQSAPLSVISGTPSTAMTAGNKIGPYVQLSLGSARQLSNVVAGMYFNTTTHMTYKCALYPQPPAFSQNTWGSLVTPTQQINTPFTPDRVPTTNGNDVVIAGGSLIHHLVLVVAGATGGGTLTCYLDGISIGNFPLNAGQVFDTIYVGSAFGGQGAHFGNLSICSLYPYQLSQTQITDHCSKGQYGMWEQTTDNCIAQLADYANIPSFWNNLQANNNGLSLTDYQDITGSNAITNMQLFEQTEQGLLFVNNQGQLTFHTRDWRMGYGAPDLLLPPDTYDANMSLEMIDQFQGNQAGFSTATYQTGAAFVNAESRDNFGAYTISSADEPTELPLITFSRAYTLLGLPNLAQWPDPHLNDAAAWIANTRQDPWTLPGGLTIDLMKTDPGGTGISACPTISQWYALDIDNMVAPSGTQPASWQDSGVTDEWFIEGINETITDTTRVLTIYTSPAYYQRAWKPGDATYGVLGSTSRIGISAPDLNTVYVQAKDVSHDAGGPYVPPSTTAMASGNMNNPAANGHGFIGGMDMRGLYQNMAQVIEPPMLILGATFNAQTVQIGATTNPQIVWDTILADTANGMGIIAGWPNWYVVTVPGFYEIDASVAGATVSSGDSGSLQSWIVVCEEGAQGLASGLSTPVTGLYMCPIGEQAPLNNNNDNTVNAPTTCLYLGIGDMITVATQSNSVIKHLAFSNGGGAILSLRWISNSVYADHCRSNNSIASGGAVTDATAFVPQTSTWTNQGSVAYLGGGAKPQGSIRQHTNTVIKQGEKTNQDAVTGSQYSAFAMPHASISAALTGNTLISASMTMTCTNTFNGEQDLMLGWTSSTAVGSYAYKFNHSGDNPDLMVVAFKKGQTLTFNLPLSMVTPFLAGTPALAYLVGNNSTKQLIYLGEWSGHPGDVTLSVTYLP